MLADDGAQLEGRGASEVRGGALGDGIGLGAFAEKAGAGIWAPTAFLILHGCSMWAVVRGMLVRADVGETMERSGRLCLMDQLVQALGLPCCISHCGG